jgi:hypothetical protein
MPNLPEVNPAIGEFVAGATAAAQGLAGKILDDDQISVSGILIRILVIGLTISIYIWFSRYYNTFETKPNILRISRNATQAQLDYAKENPKRKGLREYLRTLQAANVPASQMCLTNFYISTVNAAGIFFPSYNGVVSSEAARAAVLAGARGFVFDIWPDLTPGANFGPVIQVVEAGSAWRRISLNSLPFSSILQAIKQEGFETAMRPGSDDPLFFYLRFRGKPRSSTFDATANVLSAVFEQYRLDASHNNCRAQERIYTMPITNFFKKVVIFSNTRASGSRLADYINVGPQEGIKVEMSVEDARALTFGMASDATQRIKSNMTWIAPFSETADAENNGYNWEAAQALGIHFCAMNFWNRNDRLNKYLDPVVFGRQSFLIKPAKLRYVIEVIPDPKKPFDPKWGTGVTAGTMKDPPAIVMP